MVNAQKATPIEAYVDIFKIEIFHFLGFFRGGQSSKC